MSAPTYPVGNGGINYFGITATNLHAQRDVNIFAGSFSGTEGAWKVQLDQAAGYINQGDLESAERILKALEDSSASGFPNSVLARISGLRGHIAEVKGDRATAAKLLLAAKDLDPGTEKALSQEIHAQLLLGQNEVAHALATKYRAQFPSSGLLFSLWAQTAPFQTTLEFLEQQLPLHLKHDPEANFGLANAARARNQFDAATRYLTIAEKTPQGSRAVKLLTANVVLNAFSRDEAVTEEERSKLKELEQELAKISGKMTGSGIDKAHVLTMRALALRMLGENSSALPLLRDATALDPCATDTAFHHALAAMDDDKNNEAIECLIETRKSDDVPQNAFLLAQLLAARARGEDQSHAITILKNGEGSLPPLRPDFKAAWYSLWVLLLVRSAPTGQATEILDRVDDMVLNNATKAGLRSYIAKSTDEATAKELALLAAKTPGEIQADVRTWLAGQFQEWGQHDVAYTLWKSLIHEQADKAIIKRILTLGIHCGDEGFVLEYCREYRLRNGVDNEILDAELQTEGAISPNMAVETIKSLLKIPQPEEDVRVLRLRLSLLGLQVRNPEIIEKDANRLPHADEIKPSFLSAAIEALRHTETPKAAVHTAYKYLRRHRNDIEAHQAMFASFGLESDVRISFPIPERVESGCAVRVKDSSGLEKHFIIEDDEPDSFFDEIASDSLIAQNLIGKSVGDLVAIRAPLGPLQTGTITEILDRYSYRARDSVQTLARNPKQNILVQLHIPTGPDGKPDFTEVIRQMEYSGSQREQAIKFYEERLIPIHFATKLGGDNLLIGISNIGASGGKVKCTPGTQESFVECSQSLSNYSHLVIEPTAVATMILAEAWFNVPICETLIQCGLQCKVSEHTLLKYRRILDSIGPEKEHLNLITVEGKPIPYINVPEGLKRLHTTTKKVLDAIGSKCTVVVGEPITFAPLDAYKTLLDACGRACLHSVQIANKPGHLLWSDDFAIPTLVNQYVKVLRVWTQGVSLFLRDAGKLSQQELDKISLALLRLGYDFTQISVSTSLLAGKESEWNPNSPALNSVIRAISNPNIVAPAVFNIAKSAFEQAWKADLLEHRAQAFTISLLNSLRKHPHGYHIIFGIRGSIPRIFGLDILRADRAKQQIDLWVQANPPGNLML